MVVTFIEHFVGHFMVYLVVYCSGDVTFISKLVGFSVIIPATILRLF